MLGLMQEQPLLISGLIEFASDTTTTRRSFAPGRRRCPPLHLRRCGAARAADRVRAGSVEAGLQRPRGDPGLERLPPLELYFGITGSGRVIHTINPRLAPEQVAWIANHAEDKVVCFDVTFLPIVKAIWPQCKTVKQWIALCDADKLPADSGITGLRSYEQWIGSEPTDYTWPEFDERSAAALCYTSGTTGNPKGALYSHRSTILHAYGAALPDGIGISARESILPVVPMFHVNAWGIPYSAAMTGAKLVFPGAALDGASVYELMESERVTLSAGVPTVWLGLLNHMKQHGLKLTTMKRTVIGGSACPPAMIKAFRDEFGVTVLHAWGMTEMSPLGTVCHLKNKQLEQSGDAQLEVMTKQGRAVYGVEMRIVDPDGKELPWDGRSSGDLHVKGPWIIASYFKGEGGDPLVDGWFPTGDVATIDPDGFLQITDRSKDVIKSGGEWISSIDVENIAMAHPAVAMAACIAVPHPKWDERPLLVVMKPGTTVQRDELLAFFEGKVAKWQIPDDVVFVDSIPLGATGKMQKIKLRDQFKHYRLPSA